MKNHARGESTCTQLEIDHDLPRMERREDVQPSRRPTPVRSGLAAGIYPVICVKTDRTVQPFRDAINSHNALNHSM
jgi:hypothetical protein